MDILATLAAERAICSLKARYCRYVDTKQWDAFATLFTADATLFFPEAQAEPAGIADALAFIVQALAPPMASIHHVHSPEIEFSAPDRAHGIWAMEDRLWWPDGAPSALGIGSLTGYGHYHEDYVLGADGWKIHRLNLTRLRLERTQPVTIVR